LIGASSGLLGAALDQAAPLIAPGAAAVAFAGLAAFAQATTADMLGFFPYAFVVSCVSAVAGLLLLCVDLRIDQPIVGSALGAAFAMLVLRNAQQVLLGEHAMIDFHLGDHLFASLTCCYLDMAGFVRDMFQSPQTKKYEIGFRTL